jgi:hypothetical protein
MADSRNFVDRVGQCALAIVTGNVTSPVDLSQVHMMLHTQAFLDELSLRVTKQSGSKFTVRFASNELFKVTDPARPHIFMARVPINKALGWDHVIDEITDDVMPFILTPTKDGLLIPATASRRKPENLAEFRERVATSDAVTAAPENVTEWDIQAALGTSHDLTDLVIATLGRRISEIKDAAIRVELKRTLRRSDRVEDLYLSDILVVCALLNIDLADILKQTQD